MRPQLIIGLVTLLGVGGVMSPRTTNGPVGVTVLAAQDNPVALSEESVTAGRPVYLRFCASCHGFSGRGDGVAGSTATAPANLIDDEWSHGGSDAEIYKTIAEGVPPDYEMEEWLGRISEEDIWNVINYLKDLAAQ